MDRRWLALSRRPLRHALRAAAWVALLGVGACRGPAAAPVPAPAVSQGATELEFVDLAGQHHRLADELQRGRGVVLVFWQTWCLSCREESGTLAAAARAHPELAFFGIVPGGDDTVDDAEVLATALEWRVPYPQVRDRDLALTEAFGVTGTPTLIVLGADGAGRYRGNRAPAQWSLP
jgi:thiol-disulfide isomerase/thioredoxin